MAKITLLLGGVRSGKSSLAQEMATFYGDDVIYFVTARPSDEEMFARIEAHKFARPKNWRTFEINNIELIDIVDDYLLHPFNGCYVLDCLTVYMANLMEKLDDEKIYEYLERLVDSFSKLRGHLVVVSNEVGMGVVPPYPDGRRFRDILGKANQMFAKAADEVFLLVAGIKTQLK